MKTAEVETGSAEERPGVFRQVGRGRDDESAVLDGDGSIAANPALDAALGLGGTLGGWCGGAGEDAGFDEVFRAVGGERLGRTGWFQGGEPGVELAAQPGDDLGMVGAEVAGVGFVFGIGDVEEQRPGVAAGEDELVRELLDGGLVHPPPVERVVRRGMVFAGELREEVHAVQSGCGFSRTGWS